MGWESGVASELLPEIVEAQAEPDDDDEDANIDGRQPAREPRPDVAAENGRRGHGQGVRPNDLTVGNEDQDRHSVHYRGQYGLGRVGLVNRLRAHERQDAQHQDADPGSEVPSIDGDQELADHDAGHRPRPWRAVNTSSGKPPNWSLK